LGGGNEPMGSSYGKLMMWFYRIRCFNVLWISGGVWFSRFKFIETWPLADEVHTLSIHAWRIGSYVLRSVMTFILIFSSVTMVLAVDAGHQMKKKQSSSLHVLNHYRWFDFRRFSSLGMENFIKGNTVLLKQRRKFTSVCDKEGNVLR
jgi:cytochrome c oxidase subunit 3